MDLSADETILEACRQGDGDAVGACLEAFRERLVRTVDLRLDARVRGRIEARDVVQDAFVEVLQRLSDYAQTRPMGFFLWVRFLTLQKVLQVHRAHLGAERRDAGREAPLAQRIDPGASSLALASAFLDGGTSPSRATVRADEHERLRRALEELNEIDREVLVLRHFEHLSNAEAAEVLGLSGATASQRYVRALKRIQSILGGEGEA